MSVFPRWPRRARRRHPTTGERIKKRSGPMVAFSKRGGVAEGICAYAGSTAREDSGVKMKNNIGGERRPCNMDSVVSLGDGTAKGFR